ncbi:hypothetical protein FI667_g827, partial [Globisporangium splendens]
MTTTEFSEEHTARASGPTFPTAYDEKDDFSALKEKLAARKKPIYAGLAFLCVVVVGVSIGVSTGSSTAANNQSGESGDLTSDSSSTASKAASASTAEIGGDADSVQGTVKTTGSGSALDAAAGARKSWTSLSGSGSGSSSSAGSAGHDQAGSASNSSYSYSSSPSPSPGPTTAVPTPSPTDGPQLPYSALDFDWTDVSNWQYASGAAASSSIFTDGGIKLTPANSAEPIRTKQGWSGEKVVLIEWERSSTSDTNIWMLNTKLQSQFAVGNGWPYWGELDIFEMFTQDALDKSSYDFSGTGGAAVSSYGQLTMHMGPPTGSGDPCYCAARASKSSWYQGTSPMTSGCTAEFSNSGQNSIATVWGSDSNGQYIQLIQNPTITKGGKKNNAVTYDIATGSGAVTTKIYNNANLFWGVPASSACAVNGGHNPTTGFPFFEEFRIILEEQKKDSSAWFKVTNIQIFKKN